MKTMRVLMMTGLALVLVAGVFPVHAQTTGLARLRVTHLSNEAPSIDVYLNGELVLPNVPYASVSDYVPLEAGTHNVAIAPAGTSAEQALVEPITINIQPDTSYVIADMGQAADQSLTMLAIDESQAIDPAQANVIAVHGISDAGAVDLVAEDNGTVLASGLQYDNFAAFAVEPGQYAVNVTASGDQTNVLFTDLNPITLDAGQLYLIGLGGTIGQGADLTLEETPTSDLAPNVRFAHFGADVPAVDVFVDGQIAVPGLAYQNVSEYVELAAGSHEVMLAPAGAGLEAAMSAPLPLSLAAGHRYLMTATGQMADSTFGVMAIDETASFMNQGGDVELLMLNGISDAGPLDVILTGDQTSALASSLAFNNFAAQSLAAGQYPILITASGDLANVWFADLNPVTFGADTLYLVAVVGSAAEPRLIVNTVPLIRAAASMLEGEATDEMSAEDESVEGEPSTVEETPAAEATPAA